MKKITDFTCLTVQEGIRLSYTYSILDEDGNIVSNNNKMSFIVVDSELQKEINDIVSYLQRRD